MKKFIPQRADKINFKQMLLKGFIVKYDGGGHDFIEVIDRNADQWQLDKNVGSCEGSHRYPYAPYLVEKAIEELKAEGYVVVKKMSESSGCCQYCASYYYLA